MLKFIKYSFVAFFGFVSLMMLIGLLVSKDKNLNRSAASLDKAQVVKFSDLELKKLKSKFNVSKDKFKGTYWYQPKAFGIHSGPFCYVGESGYLHFESRYLANDWIFHRQVILLADDKKYETHELNHFEIETDVLGSGRIHELSRFKADNESAIKFISDAKGKVEFRLTGKSYYDGSLSAAQKQAFKDCYKLSEQLGI